MTGQTMSRYRIVQKLRGVGWVAAQSEIGHEVEAAPSPLPWDRAKLDSRFRTVILVCLVGTLSYVATRLGLTVLIPPNDISPLWPTNALVLAVLLLAPRRAWLVLIATAYAIVAILDLQSGDTIGSTVWLITGNLLEVLIAALAVSYFFKGVPRINSAKALAQYSLFAVVPASCAAAFVGAFAGASGGYWLHWRIWSFSDAFALLTLTPTAWGWVHFQSTSIQKSRALYVEAAVLAVALVLFGYITFIASGRNTPPVLLYSLVPLLLWPALRFGSTGVGTSVIVIAFLAIWGAAHSHGPFTEPGRLDNVLSLQLFLFFAATPFMVLAALVEDHKHAQEALRESEDKLRLLLDSTAEAIYGIDLEGRCRFCNPACLRALGYERVDELLGKNMHALTHHARANGSPLPVEECRILRAFRVGEGVHVDDEVLWRANGTSFPAEYWSYPQWRGQQLVGAVVAFIDITERKQAEEALAGVSGRLIQAQEEERTRIARELHDDITQQLALLNIGLDQLKQQLPRSLAQLRSRMEELGNRASELSNSVQTLSHRLHSSKLEHLGLVAATRGFCREFCDQYQVEVKFTNEQVPGSLPQDTSLGLFRILQAALTNALKHSGVKYFEVQLKGTSEGVHLTVRDAGVGFDLEQVLSGPGIGLISMRERVRLVNGEISIQSKPNSGTTIEVHVPLRTSTANVQDSSSGMKI
jgi:PAS domain S-box-containing protein